MKAWVVDQITDSGEMRLSDIPLPRPGPGDYLVRVQTAGVNFLDTLMIRGRYQRKPALPFTPGVELAGTIEAAGPDAPLPAGTRICASVETGAFAEFALVPAAASIAIPDELPSEEALVLLGINYPTAYYALHERAGLRAGQTVLVLAAAGGTGSAALQLAKAAGCQVVATAGGAEKVAICRRLGADAVFDYNDDAWFDALRDHLGGAGADVIFDPVGGEIGRSSLRLLAWHGRYIVIGFASGTIQQLPANRLLLREASALGVVWGEAKARDPALGERIGAAVLDCYRGGACPPLIGARFPLDRAREALEQLGSRASAGKLLLNP
jgi:NADPH2:quinone reductase